MRWYGVCVLAGVAALAGGVRPGLGAEESGSGLTDLVEFHGLVSTVYQYSFNTPDSGRIASRVISKKDNSFALNDAWLSVSRMKDDEDVGFAIDVDFGDTAKSAPSDWDGDGSLASSEETNSFELREAYLTYRLPLELAGGRPVLKAGKFVTLLGYEVLKTNDSFNPNISNSILFGFAIPFTHTGLLLTSPLGEMASFDLGVVNGWDNVDDNNRSKTLLAGFGLTPSDVLSLYVAGTYGAEQNGHNAGGPGAGAKRGVVTGNATFTGIERVTLVLDTVYGHESDLLPGSSGVLTEGADWYGAGGYAIVEIDDRLSFALRAEVFDDPDGKRNFSGVPATQWEVTPTIAYRLNDHVVARAEYRHDEASKPIHEKKARFQRGSDTLAGELLVAF